MWPIGFRQQLTNQNTARGSRNQKVRDLTWGLTIGMRGNRNSSHWAAGYLHERKLAREGSHPDESRAEGLREMEPG